jgi:hypothetical protein
VARTSIPSAAVELRGRDIDVDEPGRVEGDTVGACLGKRKVGQLDVSVRAFVSEHADLAGLELGRKIR